LLPAAATIVPTNGKETLYDVGEVFNPLGLAIKAFMNDGSVETVEGFEVSVPDFSEAGFRLVTVTHENYVAVFGVYVREPAQVGHNGKSAYELAVDAGFTGTLAEWLTSLKGADGKSGEIGDKGDKGDVGEKGEKGDKGDKGSDGDKGEPASSGCGSIGSGSSGPGGMILFILPLTVVLVLFSVILRRKEAKRN